jgi:putative transposase
MPRQARIVAPGLPHLVSQSGCGGAPIFFEAGDEDIYRDVLARELRRRDVEAWAYCLTPGRIRLILRPATAEGLSQAVGEAHRRYTNFVNVRAGWTGPLFQSRYASVAVDEPRLLAAARLVCLEPVRAGLARRPEDWAWSSVRAHLKGEDDGLVAVAPLLTRAGHFADMLVVETGDDDVDIAALRAAEIHGRPVGAPDFIADLERRLGRVLTVRKRGRPPKAASGAPPAQAEA